MLVMIMELCVGTRRRGGGAIGRAAAEMDLAEKTGGAE